MTTSPDDPIRPVLKWAGGTRLLLPHLRRYYPPAHSTADEVTARYERNAAARAAGSTATPRSAARSKSI